MGELPSFIMAELLLIFDAWILMHDFKLVWGLM